MHYATVSEATNDLKRRGFTQDFNLEEDSIACSTKKFTAEDFEITEVYRFEGPSDPADEAVVYGIEGKDGTKGVLVNGYGYSSDPAGEAIVKKLKFDTH